MREGSTPLASLLAAGAGRLRLAGLPEPRREVVRLWADLESSPRTALLAGDRAVPSPAAERFDEAVRRRAAGEPLAYVTGRAGFRHLTLAADRRALIPRPETEGLVDLVLERVRTGRAADIGTGTGCLALSLALEGSFTEVVGVDRSREALALARQNRAEVMGGDRGAQCVVRLVQGDLAAAFGPRTYDAVVSNPPYLSTDEYAALDPSVRDWEPEAALVGGPDGSDLTLRLLDDGRRVVRPGGWLALEVDCTRAADCARAAVALGWESVAVHHDLFGRERYLLARRSET